MDALDAPDALDADALDVVVGGRLLGVGAGVGGGVAGAQGEVDIQVAHGRNLAVSLIGMHKTILIVSITLIIAIILSAE